MPQPTTICLTIYRQVIGLDAFGDRLQLQAGTTAHSTLQQYSSELAMSDKHQVLFTGHSQDLTTIQESGQTGLWHTHQTDFTHCMLAVLLSLVLRCKTQCNYVRMLQFLPT